eukprot:scaffold49527_cov53-Attheya_sp.AAC.7
MKDFVVRRTGVSTLPFFLMTNNSNNHLDDGQRFLVLYTTSILSISAPARRGIVFRLDETT